MKALVDADIAARSSEEWIGSLLVNLGVNEASSLPSQATWEGNLAYILDAFHTRWPNIKVYVMRPWSRQDITPFNTMAGWIANVVGARASWASVGPDERVWLEGGDNGVTMTYDGTHYSAAGHTACAAQWKTVLGY
jgi:hypothetical protein